jgi:molybdopterin converting factor small subunit
MSVALVELKAAVRKFQAREDRSFESKELREVIDSLEGEFCANARSSQKNGEHLVNGNITAASWIARTCNMSVTSAADRLCVGAQLEELPKVKEALASGEIGYQSASVLSHLREKLGEKRDRFNEEEMLGFAREFSVSGLRRLCAYAWHVADPDGYFNEAEENFTRRRLHISQLPDGMYAVDGLLDPVTGASLKAAAESLARRKGPEDDRSHSQRMNDAVGELVQHALGQGTLPRRHGVKPHINLTTTIEGLKNEVGAPPAELELSLPISTRTLERISCDCTMSRVLLADSMVIDVGRATRVVSAPTMRALRVRDKGCRFPGCDRLVDWSSPHHVNHWARGGPSNLPNLVLLCHYHHRLVHEGGWQVIKTGREFRFLPPERMVMRRVRGPGMRWAA